MLPSQLAPVQCCACCNTIVATGHNVNLSEVHTAEKSCQLCALLLRTLKRYCNDDEPYIQIVRERSALKIGEEGPRILQLCSDSS
jgi:hypothetical protein